MSDTELHHLLNRAIDGVVLHGESDRLRELVAELTNERDDALRAVEYFDRQSKARKTRAEQAEADLARVQERACRTAELLRRAEERIAKDEPAIERVRAVLGPYPVDGGLVRAADIRATLDQPTA